MHELRHRADGVLDRSVGVDAVLVVEVDVIDSEALERALGGFAHVGGAAVDRAVDEVVFAEQPDAELGRQEDLIAARGDGAAHELLVGEGSVHVGCV